MSKILASVLILIILSASYSYAKRIQAPPKLDNVSIQEQQYLQELYDQHNTLEVVSGPVNGVRYGRNGEAIVFSSAGTVYIGVCTSTPSGYNWIAK